MSNFSENRSSILLKLIKTIHNSSNLNAIYKAVLNSVVKLDMVDKTSIYLVDKHKSEAVLVAQQNFPKSYLKKASIIPKPKGLTWKVIENGKTLEVPDVRKDPHIGPAGKNLGKHSALIIPIKLKTRVIGIIWFVSYKEHKFSEEEVSFLSTFGNHLSLALSKAKLNEELSKKNRYEKIINNVSSSVHKSIDLQDVLENAVESMSKNIEGVKNVSIYLVEDKNAVLKAYRGYPNWYIRKVRSIPYPKGTTWRTIIEGKPRYIEDASNDKVLGTAGKDIGTKSYLSMPIKFKRNTIGCININSSEINSFNNDEVLLLDKISKQIENSIKNAQQADELKNSRSELKLAKDNLEKKVEERTSELRALTAHIQSIREEERKQISREIHDELGQTLTNLKLDLFWVNKYLNGNSGSILELEKVISKTNLMTDKIDDSITTVRKIATQLRPSVLDNLGLIAAIEWQLKEFQTRTQIKCQFKNSIKNLEIKQDLSTAIFRIFQETLTNIARHSKATKVVAKLNSNKNMITLEIKDNGIGFNSSIINKTKSLGLLGMKERASMFGGNLDIETKKGKGANIILKIPST